MNRILEIGFKHVGNWKLHNGNLELDLKSHSTSRNVLYAFICNGEIKYIGKTTQQLKNRFCGYRKPSQSQSTNINNNKNILTLLKSDKPVDIFILPDNGLLNYGDFSINLAAGLEDSLISTLQPKWNGGNKEVLNNEKIDSSSDKIQNEENHPSSIKNIATDIENSSKLTIKLGTAYYNQGFINIPVKYSNEIGADGEEIEFFVNNINHPIIGYINRTANTNGTPRLMGGKKLKEKIMQHFTQDQFIEVVILTSQSIIIRSNR